MGVPWILFTIFALIALVAVPTLEKRVPDPDCSRCGRARVKHYRQIDSKTIYFCPSCVQEYDSKGTAIGPMGSPINATPVKITVPAAPAAALLPTSLITCFDACPNVGLGTEIASSCAE